LIFLQQCVNPAQKDPTHGGNRREKASGWNAARCENAKTAAVPFGKMHFGKQSEEIGSTDAPMMNVLTSAEIGYTNRFCSTCKQAASPAKTATRYVLLS
jgi:hypothetical protein